MYTLIMIAAVASGGVLLRLTQRGLPLPAFDKAAIGIGAFCGAMLAAKAPFALFGEEPFWTAGAWMSNGKTILAGLVGGYFGVELVKWVLGIRTKTGDTFAAPVALSVAVGRLACFSVGCCHGTPTDLPWGVAFAAVDQLPRHPTQLYEAAFHLLAAGELERLRREGRWRGQLFKAYVVAYCVYRFATEWIRPEARLWGGLTGYQWACLAIAALMLWLWRRDTTTATA
ncbi:MAG: prolipoprotein diacylglyceryl transferase [Planctomycetales bacterium]|nr:prolipoprotein diacylglyceryl transferase [Planctomycetales bacterium]